MPMDVAAFFEQRVGVPPTLVARAPGRVNLLGEHTDYNDLPVLPMAIQRRVCVAIRPRSDGLVVLQNVDPRFSPVEFEILPGIPPHGAGHWGNYAKAPADELARRFRIRRGFEGILASDIPVAAGLSSSSAIVTAVGLALAHINEIGLEVRAFAELMAEAERRYTGTRGGSMDQTISLAAHAGCATRLTFRPPTSQHVPVPREWRFIIADTGVRARKAGQAREAYNLRRSECEKALDGLIREVARHGRARSTPARYPDLLRALGERRVLALGEEVLAPPLFRRLRHVVTEAARVEDAVDRLRGADFTGFGSLMDASHESLRADFLVSSAELDELASIAREGGATGARLTGAGFGGCIVALADRQTAATVLDALGRHYYEPRGLVDGLDARAFVAVPSAGASVERSS